MPIRGEVVEVRHGEPELNAPARRALGTAFHELMYDIGPGAVPRESKIRERWPDPVREYRRRGGQQALSAGQSQYYHPRR